MIHTLDDIGTPTIDPQLLGSLELLADVRLPKKYTIIIARQIGSR